MQKIVDADKAILEHWGIKGMKWGIRRFQNPDGSLTAAGRKRYSDSAEGGKSTSASNKSKSKSSSGKPGSKSSSSSKASSSSEEKQDPVIKKKPSEMTDAELNAAINRMQLEKRYVDLLPKEPTPTPKQKSAVSRFISSAMKDVFLPSLTNSARNALASYLEKTFKDLMGLNAKDQKTKEKEYLDNLQQEVKRLMLEEQKRKLTGG